MSALEAVKAWFEENAWGNGLQLVITDEELPSLVALIEERERKASLSFREGVICVLEEWGFGQDDDVFKDIHQLPLVLK